ncbi:hypothetical protein ACH5RR_005221 [Cinchona calisaya]|uniref:non-specific serine/threonine protein kinase n=1 Tax=Cinchona calisaya TaxID=153742 RepID=A0ABD3AKK6_9GENT
MLPSIECQTSFSKCCFILCTFLLPCILSTLFNLPFLAYASIDHRGNETDRQAILAIKAQITHDPLGVTSSWNESVHFCNWMGVTCGHLHQRVTNLNISSLQLVGSLSPFVGNLTFLSGINLELNYFNGQIPPEIGNLVRLRHLNLTNNSFSGELPPDLSRCRNLVLIRLGWNRLTGRIPFQLGSLAKLERIHLHYNNLTGRIPETFGNLSSIKSLSLAANSLQGIIPEALGKLSTLSFLGLGVNQLSGEVDDLSFLNSLSKCRGLKMLDLSDCQFGGKLPDSVANLSANLLSLRLGGNNLSGSIPPGIQNLVNLTELQLQKNILTGNIPIGIGNLGMLRLLDLSKNELSGYIPSSLSNISQLYALHLQKNYLTGIIPLSFGNFQYLQELDLSQNLLNGTIPNRVMSITSLAISLNVSHNQLTGPLPSEVGELKNLGHLDVSQNMLSGEIPSSIGRCFTLGSLQMGNNFFEGPLPSSLSSLRGLQDLDLSHNNLSGQIPSFLQRISFNHLNLSFNQFDGQVPTEGVFKNASAISLAGNIKLCGGIPELQLPACPESKSRKKGKKSPRLKLMIPLLSGLLGLVIVMSLLIICRLRRTKRLRESPQASSPTKGFLSKVKYEDLFRGTDGFSPSNLIGTGSFGSVYRGILDPDETVVAVKVFHLQQRAALKSFMAECGALRNIKHRNLVKIYTACSSSDFQGNEFKALVYEFMPNGSLENWLHPPPEAEDNVSTCPKILGLLQRVNIAIDVASALDYLHNYCHKPIVHCDLKPGNILLDKEMIARVSDFGLAKLVQECVSKSHSNQSSSFGIRGTVGYTAPEYGTGGKVSSYGDVYSFGILLLEMFTGKRPTDSMFNGSITHHNYAKTAVHGRIDEILDPLIRPGGQEEEEATPQENGTIGQSKVDQIRECLISIVSIGIACSVESPTERMDIGDAVKELQLIRDILLASEPNYSSTSGSLRFEGSSSRSATSNWKNVL